MKRLIFAGKVALHNPTHGYLQMHVEGVAGRYVVNGGREINERSTFCRYYDRDNPDRWYISSPVYGLFWKFQPAGSEQLIAAFDDEPNESFALLPIPGDAEGRVHIIHKDGDVFFTHGAFAPPNQHLAVAPLRSPVPFTVISVTAGFDELRNYDEELWINADLSGVDFRGFADLLVALRLDPSGWRGTNLRMANFSGIDMRPIHLPSDVYFPEARLVDTIFDGRSLRDANLDGAHLIGASLQQVDLSNASMMRTIFNGANLSGAQFAKRPKFSHDPVNDTPMGLMDRTQFAGATLTAPFFEDWSYLNMRQANLRFAEGDSRDLSGLAAEGALLGGVNLSKCNLHGARFTRGNLSGANLDTANLTEANLDNCDLTGATMSHADLSRSSLQEARLRKATLASARLVGANCRAAQLGAAESLFTFPAQMRALLSRGDRVAELREGFAAHGVALAASAHLTVRDPERTWLLASDEERYLLSLDESGSIRVYRYLGVDQAAVLSGAYMPDADFNHANLFAVNMSGAHWYGAGAKADYAILEEIEASNANLGEINLQMAELRGARLSNAILANANLGHAKLGISVSGQQSSLVQALLVGANCALADLGNAVLHNAAVAVEAQSDGARLNGVPLFHMATDLAADLDEGKLSEGIKSACRAAGYPLADDATIEVRRAGTHWDISNGSSSDVLIGRGYANLGILRKNDALHVYGSAIWIKRLGGGGGAVETITFRYEATKLSEQEFNASTTCPNGRNLETNQSSGLSWEQMMTADQPPAPPSCIPGPGHWCP
ncbi:pentapeptide repeat-containing protein [Polyangium fumosum]|nr:pentapeptide repeat-containing protein [Polyangium fumosum]